MQKNCCRSHLGSGGFERGADDGARGDVHRVRPVHVCGDADGDVHHGLDDVRHRDACDVHHGLDDDRHRDACDVHHGLDDDRHRDAGGVHHGLDDVLHRDAGGVHHGLDDVRHRDAGGVHLGLDDVGHSRCKGVNKVGMQGCLVDYLGSLEFVRIDHVQIDFSAVPKFHASDSN